MKNKEEKLKKLIKELNMLAVASDKEAAHLTADDALLRYINDIRVKEAFERGNYYYA